MHVNKDFTFIPTIQEKLKCEPYCVGEKTVPTLQCNWNSTMQDTRFPMHKFYV